jgi:hypothetical protein
MCGRGSVIDAGRPIPRRPIAYCPTIIGIPFGIALFKLALVGLFALGKQVVATDALAPWRAPSSSFESARVV